MNTKTLFFSVLFSAIILATIGGYFYNSQTLTNSDQPKTNQTSDKLNRPENLQIGLNFIRFFTTEKDLKERSAGSDLNYFQPAWVFNDFADLGVQTFRQFPNADLFWNGIEPANDKWSFEKPDEIIKNPDFEPIVTLFSMQYASATPPWVKDSARFEKTLGLEAKEYLDKVIERYGSYVKYWEIGNEMDHWRILDSDPTTNSRVGAQELAEIPRARPADGFSPAEQGKFFAEVATYIRARDKDAMIVLPGLAGIEDYQLNTWLPGVIEGGGKFFDIVNYHYYSSYQGYSSAREKLAAKLSELGLDDKPVWLTETGVTSDSTLTKRTNYPNSQNMQAAEIFRRIIPAYAAGDSLVIWHTHLSSSDEGQSENTWRAYGLRGMDSAAKPASYAFKLLTSELIPFLKVETMANDPQAQMIFKITTTAGAVKYVAWGAGNYSIPADVSEYTNVVPSANGEYVWQKVSVDQSITLSEFPILMK